MSDQNLPLRPTYQGFVQTTFDALVLFETCLAGNMTHVPRRPHENERQDMIKSGNVFIYEEQASGIKRWTDGVAWSPSRILGNFLIYREVEEAFPPGEKKRALKKTQRKPSNGGGGGIIKPERNPAPQGYNLAGMPLGQQAIDGVDLDKETERALLGSLIDSYPFKEGGLIKKTISIRYRGVAHHLVSYYSIKDVLSGGLTTPSNHPILRDTMPRSELLADQNYRTPLNEEFYALPDEQREYLPPSVAAAAALASGGVVPTLDSQGIITSMGLQPYTHYTHTHMQYGGPEYTTAPPPDFGEAQLLQQQHGQHHHQPRQGQQQPQQHHYGPPAGSNYVPLPLHQGPPPGTYAGVSPSFMNWPNLTTPPAPPGHGGHGAPPSGEDEGSSRQHDANHGGSAPGSGANHDGHASFPYPHGY